MVATSSRRLRTPVLVKIDLRWSCTVRRKVQCGGDGRGGVAPQHLPGELALPAALAVGGDDELGEFALPSRFHDDRSWSLRLVAHAGAV
jgi:hypothetical protein